MTEVVKYKHSINSGDLIAALPGIRYVYKQLGKKGIIYQRLNMAADYGGQPHPVKSDRDTGVQVCMNTTQWNYLKPLLEAQEYIQECDVWEGQTVDLDFDKIREGTFTTMPFGSINRWVFYMYPAIACDLSEKWLEVHYSEEINRQVEGRILLNFTERYRNPLVTYFFLKKWEDKLIFAGTRAEHDTFCRENKLEIPYFKVSNFLELAQGINQCRFFLGNQSMCWNIAEALKKKRVVEVYRQSSNCVPNGVDGYDFIQQGGVEFYVNKFMK
jgi:hypothetical protein